MRKLLTLGSIILCGFLTANAELRNGDKFDSSYCGENYRFMVVSEKDATVEVNCLEPYYPEYYIGATINLPDYVTEPETGKEYKVVRIGSGLLAGYDRITGVVIPSTVTAIEEDAFNGCKSLKRVDFGSSIVNIDKDAFSGCESLEMLYLPETVEKIGVGAFGGCHSLTAVIIPDSVIELGTGAFGDCYSVGPLVIGKSVECIHEGTFTWMPTGESRGTTGIYEDLYMLPETPPKLYDPYMHGSGKAYCPVSSVGKYDNSDSWSMVDSHFMPLPDIFMVFYQERYLVEEGESVELLNRIYNPGNAEVVSIDWTSFNDSAVEVKDGIATGLTPGEMTTVSCRITDTTGAEYEAKCRVEVVKNTDIESVAEEDHGMDGIYTVGGIGVGDSTDGLAPGIYILRDGLKATKIIVK